MYVNKDIFDIYLVLNGKTFRPLDEATLQLTVVNLTSVWDLKKWPKFGVRIIEVRIIEVRIIEVWIIEVRIIEVRIIEDALYYDYSQYLSFYKEVERTPLICDHF